MASAAQEGDQMIGENLKVLMLSRGLSAKKLAVLSGLSDGAVYDCIRGSKTPNISTIEKIAAALDVPPKALTCPQCTVRSVRIGDIVKRCPAGLGYDVVNFGRRHKALSGKVVYIHPLYRFFVLEFTLEGGKMREAFTV